MITAVVLEKVHAVRFKLGKMSLHITVPVLYYFMIEFLKISECF